MKKLLLCIAVLLILLLPGCSLLQRDNGSPLIDPSATSPMQNTRSDGEMEALLKPLVERNLVCVEQLFYAAGLQPDYDRPVAGAGNACEVDSAEFPDYEALQDFLESTYISSVVEDLLASKPADEDYPLYFESGGKLCVNERLIMNETQRFNWENYHIQIADSSAQVCRFEVALSKLEDGRLVPVAIKMNAVKEADAWRLDGLYTGDE